MQFYSYHFQSLLIFKIPMIAFERFLQDFLETFLTSLAPCEGIVKFYHTILVHKLGTEHRLKMLYFGQHFFQCCSVCLSSPQRFTYTVYFIWLPKFTDFINSDDCIEKISSRFIGNIPNFTRSLWRNCKIPPHYTC